MLSFRRISLSALCLLISSFMTVSTNDLYEPNVVENDTVLAAPWLYPGLPIIALGSTNEQCRSDSQRVLDNIRNATTWAMQMIDASAQGADGLLMGNVHQLGNFDECLLTPTPVPRQYCLVEVTLKHPASLKQNPNVDIYNPYGSTWDKISYNERKFKIRRNLVRHALCVPASCTHHDIQASIDRHLAESPRNKSINVRVSAALCQKSSVDEVLSDGTKIYCAVMAVIVLVVVLSTLYDIRTEHDEPMKNVNQQRNAYMLSFSLKKNLSNMTRSPKDSINCIFGLKVISLCCIIYNHRMFLSVSSPITNYEPFEHSYTAWYGGLLRQSNLLVDSFLMISGILVTYIMMVKLNEHSINPFMGIFYRYVRLTPVYAVMVFFYATLMYHMGDGPTWPQEMGAERDYCRENWWTNLLYINNYVNDEHMCMIHSWYLPCDTHYYIVALFLVPLIHKFPLTGYFVLGVTTFASMVVQFVVSYVTHQDAMQLFNQDVFSSVRTQRFFTTMYIRSHVHATPYLVGILIGLILLRTKSHHRKYTWKAMLVQIAGLLVCAISLLPGYFMITKNTDYGPIVSALEQPQRRFFWPLGFGLFTIGLALSKHSVLESFLSSQPMIFLSKLSYSAYLVSFVIQQISVTSIKTSRNTSGYDATIDALPDFALSLIMALVLYLTVEAPVGNITNEFFRKKRKDSPTSPNKEPSLKVIEE